MTDIALRAYIREIDNLIEQEKLDEAIAHCRHILQTYPKFIECYRLLGKAYLEAKRFGDAADIFQRVLSAVPDDFVSHIGMSIVREDEGNLDSSIWHMERAFETNPANPAIQQELKRLIGRRDGFEPHKIRLTRGALARMYSHGELYPQSIAELHSALQEDRDRPDLQVLLAGLYWQTDQRLESAEVAGAILQKLPFCLRATRITAAVLQERGKTDEAAAYHRRLAQLDPYMAYIEAPMADTGRVDADSIHLQKLAWKPGQPLPSAEAGPSDWAASLGLEEEEIQEISTGPLPSWLGEIEEEEPVSTPEEGAPEPALEVEEPVASATESPESDEAEAGIPDWMQEAGWQESIGEVEEAPVSFSAEEVEALERGESPAAPPTDEETGDLTPAEIPGWLQGLAPEAGEPTAEAEGDDDEAELAAILGAEPQERPTPAETEPEEREAEPDSADFPAWLDEGEPGATSTIMTWLGERDEPGEDEEPAPAAEPEAEVDWMGAESPAEAEIPAEPEDEPEEVPGWLAGVAEAAAGAETAEEDELARLRLEAIGQEEEEPPVSEEPPDWLQAIAGTEEPADLEAAPEEPEEEPTELPWEAEMTAAEQETVPGAEAGADVEEDEDVPSWMAGFADEAEVDEAMAEPESLAAELAPEAEPIAEGEEDWLSGLGEELEEEDEATTWLARLGEEQAEVEEPTAIPEWMVGMDEEIPAGDDEIEDFAATWLDDLSDSLAETPAEPPPPEAMAEPPPTPEELETQLTEPVTEAEIPEDEAGDLAWLASLDDSEFEAEEELAAEAELMEPEQPAPEITDLDELDEEGVFDWLDEMASRQADAEEVEVAEQPQPTEAAAPEVGDSAPPESLEEGLEWLDRLSAMRGIDADIDAQEDLAGPAEPVTPETDELQFEPYQADEAAIAPEAEPDAIERPDISGWETEEAAAPEPPPPSEPAAPEPEPERPPAPPPIEPEAETIITSRAPEPEPPLEAEAAPPQEEEEVPEWLREHGEVGVSLEEEPEAAVPGEPAEIEQPPEEAAPAVSEEAKPPEPTAAAPERLAPDVIPEAPSAGEPEAPEPEPSVTTPSEVAEPEALPEAAEPPVEEPAAPVAEAETTPLKRARELLDAGEEQAAAAEYARLIRGRKGLPEIVQDLEAYLENDPDIPILWQTLGDAYMKSKRTKDAVRAYNRGMERTEVRDSARQALFAGDVQRAAAQYGILIKGKTELDAVIADLENALRSGTPSPILWQTLGDAYMKAGRLDDSIQAYRKGMDSV